MADENNVSTGLARIATVVRWLGYAALAVGLWAVMSVTRKEIDAHLLPVALALGAAPGAGLIALAWIIDGFAGGRSRRNMH